MQILWGPSAGELAASDPADPRGPSPAAQCEPVVEFRLIGLDSFGGPLEWGPGRRDHRRRRNQSRARRRYGKNTIWITNRARRQGQMQDGRLATARCERQMMNDRGGAAVVRTSRERKCSRRRPLAQWSVAVRRAFRRVAANRRQPCNETRELRGQGELGGGQGEEEQWVAKKLKTFETSAGLPVEGAAHMTN